jgi:hypothetical protein
MNIGTQLKSATHPAALGLFVLGGIALLGNGQKAIITSSVLVSEAQFAAFLGVAVDHVAVLMEAIIAGMVIALAAYPLLLDRFSARAIAIVACVVATASFATFAFVDMARLPAWQRDVTVYLCFTLGAAALACLAPSAQALVAMWPTITGRKVMTTVWTGAAPAGFLVAPQLVKYLLPVFGLSAYFLAFAALPLLLLALLAGIGFILPATLGMARGEPALPVRLLVSFVAFVFAFEVWSTLGSVAGYVKPMTLASLALLGATGVEIIRAAKSSAPATTMPPASAWLVGALFVLAWPTTGFFETSFLFQQEIPADFVANRSTLAAAAQIVGTAAAGVLLHRWPAREATLQLGFAGVTILGLATFASYPWIDDLDYFLWTPAITGVGSGGLTVLICLALIRDAHRFPILAALPSIAIMVGTEIGLEVLQLVYAAAQALGMSDSDAFRAPFAAQLAIALAVPALLVAGIRNGVSDERPRVV